MLDDDSRVGAQVPSVSAIFKGLLFDPYYLRLSMCEGKTAVNYPYAPRRLEGKFLELRLDAGS